ncbi:MAG: TRAP transporter small permease subunit [Pelagibacteraceae bacterium]|jgi:TRAP-type mannitol/chloroaromatic compound transport system permease small subunit|uniref:Tripartite ATP-independent periplasmic transporters DctQ component domain-containing protein n=1 Tax=marine metagenome TaxID=408172 RepID=A0A381RVY8_9ZZZZ|nr:TRAP transporter small permease subunit [Pelagibacteraceae bacterium]MBO6483417.1 TRAP transporter small permease subunit [Pelagibacteraceae bacterium]MBO6484404.1 TRAP transporter small permease subunit [Pelagibacteraceae bacterium]MBO6485588.1 TRAP transporter small permease subunit [Pelagibacteraceae bacterium]MBO6487267.1 TRAP transporter small permease subunit [Pelagibacteraceae bacterium]|tara:strand:- start:658 stop:1644 length:987 start_codon:yes stop_codon:yes gene_type:complete
MFSSHNISRFIRIVGYVIIAITFAFLINNFLNYWADWPGVKKLLANYGLFGFEKLKNPISGSLFTYALFQLFLYIVLIFLVVFFVFKTPNQTLNKDSEILSSLSAYIIRSAFWMVFIVGLVDLTISFLATEKLLIIIFNEKIHLNLISPPFRIKFIHVPLIFVSMILGYFTRTLGFIWLAILVIFAEFSIVITRFIFSYEQAFMGDLVRFWYGALFLFASAHALIHEGHVRVDVLYTNFSDRARAWTNTIGSFLFGIPLCLIILFLGMSSKASIINSPLLSFEITQQGSSGLYVKYLMAAFLAIFALSMLTQFTSYFMKNFNKIINSS